MLITKITSENAKKMLCNYYFFKINNNQKLFIQTENKNDLRQGLVFIIFCFNRNEQLLVIVYCQIVFPNQDIFLSFACGGLQASFLMRSEFQTIIQTLMFHISYFINFFFSIVLMLELGLHCYFVLIDFFIVDSHNFIAFLAFFIFLFSFQ